MVDVKLTFTEPSPSKATPDVPFRPRAKINSSARPKSRTDAPTPRAVSPTPRTAPARPKVAVVKPPPKSTPTTPRSRLRSRESSVSLQQHSIDGRHSPSPSVRIKSKVTPVLSPRAPPLPSTSPPAFYPITTATPAANPHRYTSRSPPQPPSYTYLSFRGTAGDPATVPLPPTHSPPTSTLSFSSRSSVSATSDDHLRSTLTTLLCPPSSSAPDDHETDDDSTQDLKAEAKSNRKIADLEITNRSLLAINASLESTKHKQAKEIRDLRRKLRESRLVLPPRAFRAVNDTDPDPDASDESDDDDEDEEDESKDEVYVRIKAMLENLLETGRRALESQPSDFVQGGKGGAKVLSADEVRSLEDGGPKGEEYVDADADPSHIAVPDSEGSEDEVERALVPPIS